MTEQPVEQAVAPEIPSDVTSDDKLWALLAYLFTPLLPLIILLMEEKKNRPFLRYHAVQALALGVVISVSYLFVITCCLSPLYFGAVIYFGIQAYNGEYVVIPLLTDFCKQQKWL